MKTPVSLVVIALTTALFQFCSSSSESLKNVGAEEATRTSIVIYGSNTCDHCLDFKAKLDSVGLKYIFNDVEVNDAQAEVMVNLVRSANHQGGIQFPVVYLNDKEVMIAPDFEFFMGRL